MLGKRMLFNPSKKRWAFSPEGGMLSILLDKKIDVSGPIGNFAALDLGSIISGWLAGYAHSLTPALERSLVWVNRAIDSGENFGEFPIFHTRTLHKTLSLIRWMLFEDVCISGWQQAISFDNEDWDFNASFKNSFNERLRYEDRLAFLLQAGEYKECESLYAYVRGDRPPRFKGWVDPGDYAYVVCGVQAGKYAESDSIQLGHRLLRKYLESDWLGHGQCVTAAMWLKIVLWDSDIRAGRKPSLTPLETILKAYEYMPRVETPEFVQRQNQNTQPATPK